MNNKNLLISKLKDKIHENIPISDIIETRIEINAKRTDAICPFHEDSKIGSFKISDNKGIFTCFTCGETGDGITFIQKFDKCSFIEAVLRIALEFGLIKENEYKLYSKEKYKVKKIKEYHKISKIDVKERANAEKTNAVYEALAKCFPLNIKDRKYLNNRNISDEEIEKVGYFSLSSDIKKIQRALKIISMSFSDLSGVPGFYYTGGQLQMVGYDGIAIPIKNVHKQIQAIQIRKSDVKDNENRYVWFSSSNMNNGTSVGCPVDVSFPLAKAAKPAIAICEGHFKARVLSKRTGAIAISIQGVNNTKELLDSINPIIEKKTIKQIAIFFDADMCKNASVEKALESLINLLKPLNIQINVYVWNMKYGKGIDDYVFNKGTGHRSIPADKFVEKYKEYVNKAYSIKAGTLLKDMPEDKLSELWDEIIKI